MPDKKKPTNYKFLFPLVKIFILNKQLNLIKKLLKHFF